MEDNLSNSPNAKHKHKVVVIMGATGCGKSRLAIDLAQRFPSEILNADSMQVYKGLDITTNKVPVEERKGVPHHLLGTINSDVNFTTDNFREMAIPIIDSIISRKHLPIIVGGSNSFIQALVCSYVVDDVIKNGNDDLKTSKIPFSICSNAGSANDLHKICDDDVRNTSNQFDQVEEIGPAATNGLHPNDFSKGQKWDTGDSFRYDCCFLWLDASLPVLCKFVEDRVDFMIEAGLLEEVSAFYDPKADYTQGMWQAIGLCEFKDFFNAFPPEANGQEIENLDKGRHKILLDAAIERMKTNTRRLVYKQKERINGLKTSLGWNLHQLDSTKALETSGSESLELWEMMVVNNSIKHVERFLAERACEASLKENVENRVDSTHSEQAQDLWTPYGSEDRLAEIKCLTEHANGSNINLVVHIGGKFCDLKKFTDLKNNLQD